MIETYYYYHEIVDEDTFTWAIFRFLKSDVEWSERVKLGSVTINKLPWSSIVFCSNEEVLEGMIDDGRTVGFTIEEVDLPLLTLEKEIKNCIIDIFYHDRGETK